MNYLLLLENDDMLETALTSNPVITSTTTNSVFNFLSKNITKLTNILSKKSVRVLLYLGGFVTSLIYALHIRKSGELLGVMLLLCSAMIVCIEVLIRREPSPNLSEQTFLEFIDFFKRKRKSQETETTNQPQQDNSDEEGWLTRRINKILGRYGEKIKENMDKAWEEKVRPELDGIKRQLLIHNIIFGGTIVLVLGLAVLMYLHQHGLTISKVIQILKEKIKEHKGLVGMLAIFTLLCLTAALYFLKQRKTKEVNQ